MKRLCELVGFILFMAGCGPAEKSGVPAFLPGIYVAEFTTEFSHVVDTFVIRRIIPNGNQYRVTRKSTFQRIKGESRSAAEWQTDEWMAAFDPEKGMLMGVDKNKQLGYSSEENKLFNAGQAYEKVE